MICSDVVAKVSVDLPLFESESDRDAFLKGAIGVVKEDLGADMAAAFISDGKSGNLRFRAGLDAEGICDRTTCPEGAADSMPDRFDFSGSEAMRAFSEGRVLKISYRADDPRHRFQSKIIVPVARGPVRMGILILAARKPDAFDSLDEGEFLATITSLGDLLEDASALISGGTDEGADGSRIIHGRRAGDGMALGKAFPIWSDLRSAEADDAPGSAEEELRRFDAALERSIIQLEELQGKAESGVSETGALIFTAQALMLRDEAFTGSMRERVVEGDSAPAAIRAVVQGYADRFAEMAERRLSEKAQDVRDLGHRLITNLSGGTGSEFSYAGRIILAGEIFPSDLFRLSLEGASGVVLAGTAVTAHISILAKSLGLPVMITDDKSLLSVREGSPLVLDADSGRLYVNPAESTEREYRTRLSAAATRQESYTLRGRTSDGTAVMVMANVNILKDAEEARTQAAEGIGLYRSEFPFILKNDILSEEQQYQIYRSVAGTQADKPVTFRTADIGGDKILQGREEPEENPFLGVRGIRFSLTHRTMFRDQLRAMLRAGAGTDLGIMLPMVSGAEEVVEAKLEIERCKDELLARGVRFNDGPRVGAMVELPSAALAVDELAEETDFLSIGTNDLTMYLLAVDRTNEALSHLYSSHHPAILRTLASIVRDARERCPDISVCGEAAEDPILTPFFVGIGIRKLSVSPAAVEPMKKRLAEFSLSDAEAIASEMLAISRVGDMDRWLENFRERGAPG